MISYFIYYCKSPNSVDDSHSYVIFLTPYLRLPWIFTEVSTDRRGSSKKTQLHIHLMVPKISYILNQWERPHNYLFILLFIIYSFYLSFVVLMITHRFIWVWKFRLLVNCILLNKKLILQYLKLISKNLQTR